MASNTGEYESFNWTYERGWADGMKDSLYWRNNPDRIQGWIEDGSLKDWREYAAGYGKGFKRFQLEQLLQEKPC